MARPEKLERSWEAVLNEADPLVALRAARELRESLGDWESHLARVALTRGETWETIGAALGISRQGAWERLRPAIAGEIEAERTRLRQQRIRLSEDRRKRWPTKN